MGGYLLFTTQDPHNWIFGIYFGSRACFRLFTLFVFYFHLNLWGTRIINRKERSGTLRLWRKVTRYLTKRTKTHYGYQSRLTNIFMGGAIVCLPIGTAGILSEHIMVFYIFSMIGFSFGVCWAILQHIDEKNSPSEDVPQDLEGYIMTRVWEFIKKLFKS